MKTWRKALALVLAVAMAASTMAVAASADEVETPRNETLYYGGLQYGKANDANPYSTNSNNFPMNQNDNARELVWETLYMYNLLDNELYPLLADGAPEISEDQTTITVKLNADAHFSDGADLTAADVVATYDYHVNLQTSLGIDYSTYIASVEAVDDDTVVFTANMDNFNPLKLQEILPKMYICEKAYLDEQYAACGEDSEAFKTLEMFDAPHTGPYTQIVASEEKTILERDENYWGQAESMWGSLPAPKYLVHNIYSGNDATEVAFRNGEVDMDQQFLPSIWELWETDGLPISTYIEESPYFLDASMPSIWFNCANTDSATSVAEVRRAIGMAIDYDQIASTAMSGYTYSFAECPRSLFNPTDGEQAWYDKCNADGALEALNFAGKDYDGANALLDEAGIVDTDGDGIREYNGENITLKVECPSGWSDWNASCELVAAAGKEIGLNIETYFPETAVWTEDYQTGNFDIIMFTSTGASIDAMWLRSYNTLYGFGGEFPERLTYSISRYYNAEADEILAAIPTETDEDKLVEYYTTLNEIYLTDCPAIALMYRPVYFHEVNESVWTGFPEQDDGTNIPPTCCMDGYGVAALYNLYLVEE